MAEKRGSKGKVGAPASLADEVKAAVGEGGHDGVWVREDGAVCFGNECVVIKQGDQGGLDLTIKPDQCGSEAGSVILEHIYKTAGKGVNIVIPPADITLPEGQGKP